VNQLFLKTTPLTDQSYFKTTLFLEENKDVNIYIQRKDAELRLVFQLPGLELRTHKHYKIHQNFPGVGTLGSPVVKIDIYILNINSSVYSDTS
jgi:hypothetical protein